MNLTPVFSALTALTILWQSSRMIRRPNTYLGEGPGAATDPRTVRQFGIAGAVLSGALLALILTVAAMGAWGSVRS